MTLSTRMTSIKRQRKPIMLHCVTRGIRIWFIWKFQIEMFQIWYQIIWYQIYIEVKPIGSNSFINRIPLCSSRFLSCVRIAIKYTLGDTPWVNSYLWPEHRWTLCRWVFRWTFRRCIWRGHRTPFPRWSSVRARRLRCSLRSCSATRSTAQSLAHRLQ